jgi:hypothetical protein
MFLLLLCLSFLSKTEHVESPPYRISPTLASGMPAPPCWLDVDNKRVAILFDKQVVIDKEILFGGHILMIHINNFLVSLEPFFVQRLMYRCIQQQQQEQQSENCYDAFKKRAPLSSSIPLECYNSTYIAFSDSKITPCSSLQTCLALSSSLCQNHHSPLFGRCQAVNDCSTLFDCKMSCRCAFLQPTQPPLPTSSPTLTPTQSPTTKAPTLTPTTFIVSLNVAQEVTRVILSGEDITNAPTNPTDNSSISTEAITILVVLGVVLLICILNGVNLYLRSRTGKLYYR